MQITNLTTTIRLVCTNERIMYSALTSLRQPRGHTSSGHTSSGHTHTSSGHTSSVPRALLPRLWVVLKRCVCVCKKRRRGRERSGVNTAPCTAPGTCVSRYLAAAAVADMLVGFVHTPLCLGHLGCHVSLCPPPDISRALERVLCHTQTHGTRGARPP